MKGQRPPGCSGSTADGAPAPVARGFSGEADGNEAGSGPWKRRAPDRKGGRWRAVPGRPPGPLRWQGAGGNGRHVAGRHDGPQGSGAQASAGAARPGGTTWFMDQTGLQDADKPGCFGSTGRQRARSGTPTGIRTRRRKAAGSGPRPQAGKSGHGAAGASNGPAAAATSVARPTETGGASPDSAAAGEPPNRVLRRAGRGRASRRGLRATWKTGRVA